MDPGSQQLMDRRIKVIFEILLLSRYHYSEVFDDTNQKRLVSEGMPKVSTWTQDLRFTPEEILAYEEHEGRCGTPFGFDLDVSDLNSVDDV